MKQTRIIIFLIIFLKISLAVCNHKVLMVAPPDKPDSSLTGELIDFETFIAKLINNGDLFTNDGLQPMNQGQLQRIESKIQFNRSLLNQFSLEQNTLPDELSIIFSAHGSPRTDSINGLQLWTGPNTNRRINFSSYLDIIERILKVHENISEKPIRINILVASCYAGLCINDFNNNELSKNNNHEISILGFIDGENTVYINNFHYLLEEAKNIDAFFESLVPHQKFAKGSQMQRWLYYLSLVPEWIEVSLGEISFRSKLSLSKNNTELKNDNFLNLSLEHKILFAVSLTKTRWGFKKLPFVLQQIKEDAGFKNYDFEKLINANNNHSTNFNIIYFLLLDKTKELAELCINIDNSASKLKNINLNFFSDMLDSLETKELLKQMSFDAYFKYLGLKMIYSNEMSYYFSDDKQEEINLYIRLFYNALPISKSSLPSNTSTNNFNNIREAEINFLRSMYIIWEVDKTMGKEENARLIQNYNVKLIEAAERQINSEIKIFNTKQGDLNYASRVLSILSTLMSSDNLNQIESAENALLKIIESEPKLKQKLINTLQSNSKYDTETYATAKATINLRFSFLLGLINEEYYNAEINKLRNRSKVIELYHPNLYARYFLEPATVETQDFQLTPNNHCSFQIWPQK